MNIRAFTEDDTLTVIALWNSCGLTRPWNNPELDITRKLTVQPELFLVGEVDEKIIATAMAGYDGHRGAVYYLGVHPDYHNKGYGKQLMVEVERLLLELGCPKLNILVRSDDADVLKFYESLGYTVDPVSCVSKRLIPDT